MSTTPGAPKDGGLAKDAAAAAKAGDGPVGTPAADTPQTATEAAHEGGSQNLPATRGDRPRLEVVDVRRGMFGAADAGDTSGYGGLVKTVAMPGESERPYGGWFDEAADRLADLLRDPGGGISIEPAA